MHSAASRSAITGNWVRQPTINPPAGSASSAVRPTPAWAGSSSRIGQEVLIGHLNGDIERPYVMGSLYNGKGEGGIPATPGGNSGETDTTVFDQATDHRPAGQGNLAGGNGPAWRGGAGNSHHHADVMSDTFNKMAIQCIVNRNMVARMVCTEMIFHSCFCMFYGYIIQPFVATVLSRPKKQFKIHHIINNGVMRPIHLFDHTRPR